MTHAFSRILRVLAVAVAAFSLSVGAWAQATQSKQSATGAAKVTTTQLKGEVAYLQGDDLVAKMIPSGTYRLFRLRPGKTATIDGVFDAAEQSPDRHRADGQCDRDGDAGCRPDDHDPEG